MRYRIVLMSHTDEEIIVKQAESRIEANTIAKYLLSEQFAKDCESTHENLNTSRVLIFKDGILIADRFLK